MNDKWVRRINGFWVFIWSLLFAGIAIVLIVVINSGQRTDSGSEAGKTEIKALKCTSSTFSYPFFTDTHPTHQDLAITIIHENDTAHSMFLQYILSYSSEEEAVNSEAINHAAMNIAFGKDKLEAGAYSASYATLGRQLKFSLYASGNDITSTAFKYFLLDYVSSNNIQQIRSEYAKIGLQCVEDSQGGKK